MKIEEQMYGDAVLKWKREIEINNIKYVNELIEKQQLISFIETNILDNKDEQHSN